MTSPYLEEYYYANISSFVYANKCRCRFPYFQDYTLFVVIIDNCIMGAFHKHWVYKLVTVTNKQRMLEFKFTQYNNANLWALL